MSKQIEKLNIVQFVPKQESKTKSIITNSIVFCLASFAAIALNKELKWTDLRVLLFLLANVKGSFVEISQSSVAQKLDIKASNVSRSIRKLEEQGNQSKDKLNFGRIKNLCIFTSIGFHI